MQSTLVSNAHSFLSRNVSFRGDKQVNYRGFNKHTGRWRCWQAALTPVQHVREELASELGFKGSHRPEDHKKHDPDHELLINP